MKRTTVEEFDEAGKLKRRIVTEEDAGDYWWLQYPLQPISVPVSDPFVPPFTITCDSYLNNC